MHMYVSLLADYQRLLGEPKAKRCSCVDVYN